MLRQQSKWLAVLIAVLVWSSCTLYPGMTSASAQADKASSISIAYQVKPGDTLYGIARTFYMTGDYVSVAATNGWDPNASLKAGSTLTLKNPLILAQYDVKPGDTLYAITNRYFNRNYYMNVLMAYNGIKDPGTGLKAGMSLRIPQPTGEKSHKVLARETLYSLSAQYFKQQDYQQMLASYNKIAATPDAITAGQRLQIPNPYYAAVVEVQASNAVPERLSIEISLGSNKLYVLSGTAVMKSFNIASGKAAGLTPKGSFEIVTKIKNPWYSAKGIPGGDPSNPLGSRWLGLNVAGTHGTKYGIHGTNAPDSIGTYASAGCIRMQNKDVIWLYNTIPTGTKVTIAA